MGSRMSAYAVPSVTSAPEVGVPLADTVQILNAIAVGQTHVLMDLQPLAAANGCQ
jgi:hypothetical protein